MEGVVMASEEYCICCGKEIPEGSQVCIMCEYKAKGKQRQIDRIRKMDIEELEKMVQELIAENERLQEEVAILDSKNFMKDKLLAKAEAENEQVDK